MSNIDTKESKSNNKRSEVDIIPENWIPPLGIPIKPSISEYTTEIDGKYYKVAYPKGWCNECGSPCSTYGNCYNFAGDCKTIAQKLKEYNKNQPLSIINMDNMGRLIGGVWCKNPDCGYLISTYDGTCINGCPEQLVRLGVEIREN